MKIRLSDKESYEIELPQEIDKRQLVGIISRLKAILKIGVEEPFEEEGLEPDKMKYKRTSRAGEWTLLIKSLDTREKAIEFLNEHLRIGTKAMVEKYKVPKQYIFDIGYRKRKEFGIVKGVDYGVISE